MSTPEFRVRPVIRHVVTRYTPPEPLPPGSNSASGCASLETLGEFGNEGYAEIVKQALEERVAPRVYAIVESTLGDINARVWYAQTEDEAMQRLVTAQEETGKTFRIFSRIPSLMGV